MEKGDKKEPRYVAKYNSKLDVFEVEDTKTGKIIDTYAKVPQVSDQSLYWLYAIPIVILVLAMIINGILIS